MVNRYPLSFAIRSIEPSSRTRRYLTTLILLGSLVSCSRTVPTPIPTLIVPTATPSLPEIIIPTQTPTPNPQENNISPTATARRCLKVNDIVSALALYDVGQNGEVKLIGEIPQGGTMYYVSDATQGQEEALNSMEGVNAKHVIISLDPNSQETHAVAEKGNETGNKYVIPC